MKMLKDSFGRTFPYIRLSITDVCNFKCGYCLPNGYQKDKSDNRTFLTYEEIGRLAKGLSELGVCKIRLTGGDWTSYNYRKAMQDAGYKNGDFLGGKMFPTLYESI